MKYRDMNGTATQTERADDRQVKNNAGGYVYEVSAADRLRRFLVLGTEGGTFYASQRDLTRENTHFLAEYAKKNPEAFWNVLKEVNATNTAPRHSTVLFALATLWRTTADAEIKKLIKNNFLSFVRTGTHLFEFTDYVTASTKGSRGLRSMLSSWYTDDIVKGVNGLAYQVLKYRQRGGWTHRDVVRLAHPKTADPVLNQVINYAVNGPTPENVEAAPILGEFESVKAGDLDPKGASLLSWEMLPTESLKDPGVWRALISDKRLPYTAMLRNLGRMTALDVFTTGKYGAEAQGEVIRRLADPERIKASRVHPFSILLALKTYTEGSGFRGSLTWSPKQPIVDALDEAFRLAFGNVESTGKRVCLALDISGSMGMYKLMNTNVSAREASAAMAMATLSADPNTTDTVAFTSRGWTAPTSRRFAWGGRDGIEEISLSARRRLDDNVRTISNLPMGGTDCALPMLWAQDQGRAYDAFVVYTDSETWAGEVQPMEALRDYRRKMNPEARLIVVGMTSRGFTIADPQDRGSLDVVGFDASAPRIISDFIAGKF